MRRRDKQIRDQSEIQDILEKNWVCRLAFSKENIPYIVPVNSGYSQKR